MKRGIMKRITALLTAGILIVGGGIHALPVHAEEKYEFVLITEESELDDLESRIIQAQTTNERNEIRNFGATHGKDINSVYILCNAICDPTENFNWREYESQASLVNLHFTTVGPNNTPWNYVINELKNKMKASKNIYLLTRKSASSTSSQNQDQSPSQAAHTHAYSWVTVQEANVSQDGIEEYRCSCGDVQDRAVIPASQVFVNGLYGSIKDTPANGTATYDSKNLYTLSDYVVRKLAERTDVTTIINFTYQGTAYRMTIPAGTDFTSLLADTDYFYGYFYFAQQTGAMIETA